MKNFAGIIFRESPTLKYFAGVNFRESRFSGDKKGIYFRESGQNSRNFLPAKISSLKLVRILQPVLSYSQVANRRRMGVNKRGCQNYLENLRNWLGQKSILKTKKFTLIYSKTIIDKACRLIMLTKNASNRSQAFLLRKHWKYVKSIVKTPRSEMLSIEIDKRRVLSSEGGIRKINKLPPLHPPLATWE